MLNYLQLSQLSYFRMRIGRDIISVGCTVQHTFSSIPEVLDNVYSNLPETILHFTEFSIEAFKKQIKL